MAKPWRRVLVCVLFAQAVLRPGAGGASPCWASAPQPEGGPASVLVERPLQAALDDATARNRFLIVVTSPTREKVKENQALWDNPGLASWCARHAVVAHITDRDTIKTLQDAGLVTGVPDQPLLFRNGKQERMFGSSPKEGGGVAGVRLRQPPKDARPTKDGGPHTSLRLVMRLEWTLRSFRTRDEAWHTAHLASNPPINPEPMPPLFHEARKGGTPVPDGPDAALGEADAVDAMARLLTAVRDSDPKATESAGDVARSVGLMTWLWERGAREAAFEPVLLGTAARWSRALGEREPAARARLEALRLRAAGDLPALVDDDRAFYRWLMLARAGGAHVEALDTLDAALDDPDAAGMMPRADRLILESMLPWANWADPWTLPGVADGSSPTRRLRAALDAKPPRNVSPAEWARVQSFRRWLLAVGGCRHYALCLAGGGAREAEAGAIAEILRGAPGLDATVLGTSPIGTWLAAAAIAEGEARAEHVAWLEADPSPAARRLEGHARAQIAARQK